MLVRHPLREDSPQSPRCFPGGVLKPGIRRQSLRATARPAPSGLAYRDPYAVQVRGRRRCFSAENGSFLIGCQNAQAKRRNGGKERLPGRSSRSRRRRTSGLGGTGGGPGMTKRHQGRRNVNQGHLVRDQEMDASTPGGSDLFRRKKCGGRLPHSVRRHGEWSRSLTARSLPISQWAAQLIARTGVTTTAQVLTNLGRG